jgi:hypothetical protein
MHGPNKLRPASVPPMRPMFPRTMRMMSSRPSSSRSGISSICMGKEAGSSGFGIRPHAGRTAARPPLFLAGLRPVWSPRPPCSGSHAQLTPRSTSRSSYLLRCRAPSLRGGAGAARSRRGGLWGRARRQIHRPPRRRPAHLCSRASCSCFRRDTPVNAAPHCGPAPLLPAPPPPPPPLPLLSAAEAAGAAARSAKPTRLAGGGVAGAPARAAGDGSGCSCSSSSVRRCGSESAAGRGAAPGAAASPPPAPAGRPARRPAIAAACGVGGCP